MQKTQKEAQRDALTQVLNRAGWEVKLLEAARTKAEVAVGFLDLDCLKAVNDSRGHSAGDDLLRLTAHTIQSVLRSDDQIARLGGDEFAVMLYNDTMADASTLKERLQFALSTFDIQASIGIALGSEAASLQAAVQLADARMYEEKRARRRSRTYGAGRPTIIPR
jgi:diguanylate cyclase (GGDEF)-like protein